MVKYSNVKCTNNYYKEQTEEESQCIEIRVGVFFDGTSNNYYNTDYRKKIPTRIIVMACIMHTIAIEGTTQMSPNYTKHTKLKEMILKFI